MTIAHAKGMLRLHKRMARCLMLEGQAQKAKAAERRAEEVREFIRDNS